MKNKTTQNEYLDKKLIIAMTKSIKKNILILEKSALYLIQPRLLHKAEFYKLRKIW